ARPAAFSGSAAACPAGWVSGRGLGRAAPACPAGWVSGRGLGEPGGAPRNRLRRVPTDGEPRDPVADLRRIAFLLERAHEPTYRVRAFRAAAGTLERLGAEEVSARSAAGTLTDLPGIGTVTARCVAESLAGQEPVDLRRLVGPGGRA